MKPAMLALMLTAGSLFAETSVSIGIGIGIGAPPPPVVAYAVPACPGPGYVWVPGYWYPVGLRYRWHDGYWALPPYPGGYWVAPRYYKHRYYPGYWKGGRVKAYRIERRGWDWDGGRRGYHKHHRRWR